MYMYVLRHACTCTCTYTCTCKTCTYTCTCKTCTCLKKCLVFLNIFYCFRPLKEFLACSVQSVYYLFNLIFHSFGLSPSN